MVGYVAHSPVSNVLLHFFYAFYRRQTMNKNYIRPGDYILINEDIDILPAARDSINYHEAYKVVGKSSAGGAFQVLDHNSKWTCVSFGKTEDAPYPALEGKGFWRLGAHCFIRTISPSCPLAKKATDFWRQCFA